MMGLLACKLTYFNGFCPGFRLVDLRFPVY